VVTKLVTKDKLSALLPPWLARDMKRADFQKKLRHSVSDRISMAMPHFLNSIAALTKLLLQRPQADQTIKYPHQQANNYQF